MVCNEKDILFDLCITFQYVCNVPGYSQYKQYKSKPGVHNVFTIKMLLFNLRSASILYYSEGTSSVETLMP